MFHHFFCHSIPLSSWFGEYRFRTIFLLIQAPRKTNDHEGICEHVQQLSVNCVLIVLCFLFGSHTMSLNIDMKMILPLKCSGSHCRSVSSFLNLLDEAQRCDSWEYCLLELRRHSIDSIHLYCFPTTIEFASSSAPKDHLPFSPRRAPSRRRRGLWRR